jgi:hypothetical protein
MLILNTFSITLVDYTRMCFYIDNVSLAQKYDGTYCDMAQREEMINNPDWLKPKEKPYFH